MQGSFGLCYSKNCVTINENIDPKRSNSELKQENCQAKIIPNETDKIILRLYHSVQLRNLFFTLHCLMV